MLLKWLLKTISNAGYHCPSQWRSYTLLNALLEPPSVLQSNNLSVRDQEVCWSDTFHGTEPLPPPMPSAGLDQVQETAVKPPPTKKNTVQKKQETGKQETGKPKLVKSEAACQNCRKQHIRCIPLPLFMESITPCGWVSPFHFGYLNQCWHSEGHVSYEIWNAIVHHTVCQWDVRDATVLDMPELWHIWLMSFIKTRTTHPYSNFVLCMLSSCHPSDCSMYKFLILCYDAIRNLWEPNYHLGYYVWEFCNIAGNNWPINMINKLPPFSLFNLESDTHYWGCYDPWTW